MLDGGAAAMGGRGVVWLTATTATAEMRSDACRRAVAVAAAGLMNMEGLLCGTLSTAECASSSVKAELAGAHTRALGMSAENCTRQPTYTLKCNLVLHRHPRNAKRCNINTQLFPNLNVVKCLCVCVASVTFRFACALTQFGRRKEKVRRHLGQR